MKIIQYGLFVGLMMASMMPVAQAEEIAPRQSNLYQITFTDSLPTITVADKILVMPAPVATLSNRPSNADILASKASKSESNALAEVEINGQFVQASPAQVIFHTP